MNDLIYNPNSDAAKVAHYKATRSARCEWCLIHFKIRIEGSPDWDNLQNHRPSCKHRNSWSDCYQLMELEQRKKKYEEEQEEKKKKKAIEKLRKMEQRKRQIEQDRKNEEIQKRKQDRLNQRMRKDRHYDPYSNNYGPGGQAGLKPRGRGRGRGQGRGTGRGRGRGRDQGRGTGRGRGGGQGRGTGVRKMKQRQSGYHGSTLIRNDNNQRSDNNIIFIH